MNVKLGPLLLWGSVLSTIAVAATIQPLRSALPRQTRKTTDPPVPARGKLGQDLFLAIDHRSISSVQALLKKGADANARNGLEFTPLDVAAASHQQEVMQALLNAGAQPDAPSAYGTALTFASATANAEGANLLFARNVDVNVARGDGNTPLMMAANAGRPDLVAELIKRKADVNAKNICDSTPLMFAARQGNVAAGAILLDNGAEVDAADIDGITPLMAAAMTGHADFVALLIKHGAKVNAHDDKSRTPLILTASCGNHPEVVKVLLDAGADRNASDSKGRTAASIAAAHGYAAASALLGRPSPEAAAATGKPRDAKTAIGASLKLLQGSMAEFSRNASCVSCHQEGLGRMATAAAKAHGFTIDNALRQAQMQRINGMIGFMRPMHAQALKDPEAMKQIPLVEINEVTTVDSWLMGGMAAFNDPATPGTAEMALVLGRQQQPDGHWSFSLPRVPMQSSVFGFTALAARALATYAPNAVRGESAKRVEAARSWLAKNEGKTSDDLAFRLLGLKWTGAPMSSRSGALKAVLAAQQPDGGWAQAPGLQSDAYATGQALYALSEAGGVKTSSTVYRKGVEFLLRTQDEQGAWFVNKRAIPANNYFDAGFPYGESQYASFNGTCWAMIALLQTMPLK